MEAEHARKGHAEAEAWMKEPPEPLRCEGCPLTAKRDEVIKGIQECDLNGGLIGNCPYKGILLLLKEQEKKKFFVDSDGKITPFPDIVRCKDCVHRGKAEKCVLAAIAAEKDFPLFMLDNHGEWYCADGKKRNDDDD